jgi:predicted transcriptional regulator
MDNTSRVAQWRQKMRDEGKESMTIWLSREAKLCLEDMASIWRMTPSELIEQALAQFHPGSPQSIGNVTDTVQLREAVEAVLADVLPARIQAALQGWQLVTAMNSNVTETLNGNVTETIPTQEYEAEPGHSILTEPAPMRRSGRQRSEMGTRILALLQNHPEGLTAEQMRGYLTPDKSIADILAGMRRLGTVTAEKEGRGWRYFAQK